MVLPANDLQHLLSAITESYNEYFVDTYQDKTLPNDYLSAINEETLDYLETLDEVSNSMNYLASYCDDRAALLPNYRTTEGVSFTDLAKTIRRLKSTDIDYIYSYISLNNVYKDKLVLKTYCEMQKRQAELDLVETNANITTLQNSIDNYKNALAQFAKTNESYEEMAYNYSQAAIVMRNLGNIAKAEKLQQRANQYYQKAQLQQDELELAS